MRRLIGAYLDGALAVNQARVAEHHLASCRRCQQEADELRRLKALLVRAAVSPAAVPTWTGFWPEVVGRIEDGTRRTPVEIGWRWPRTVWLPRLAYGGALAAAVLLSLTLWGVFSSPSPEGRVLIRSARTDLPGGTVMVYSPPEKDMAVVWIFDEN